MIRKAIEADLHTIYSFERMYILEHEPKQIEKWDKAKESIKEQLKASINNMFVKETEGQLDGYAYWGLHEQVPCVYSIYVSKEVRGQGLASKLLQELEKDVFNDNQILTLATLESNPAQYLFDKAGFKRLKVENGWIHYEKKLK